MKLLSTASVIYETQIIDAKTGRTIKRNAPKRNLLLDSGLDGIAVRSWWDSFSHCVLGSGTTPTKRDSGAITVSITSEVATASAGYFEAADVGRLLKLDSGQEVYIDGYTSTTEVTVTGASDDAASEATIWYVNETGHGSEEVRSSTLADGSSGNGSTWDGSKAEHKRTFIFPTETGALTYREIGWSHTSSAGNNLFGRDLIPGGGDSIAPGQRYKVTVRLRITPSPITQVSIPNVGGTWDTSGDAIISTLYYAFYSDYEGENEFYDTTGNIEPYSSKGVQVLNSDFTLPSAPVDTPGTLLSGNEATRAGYVPGSREVGFSRTFSVSQGNGTIYGLSIIGGAHREFMKIKFDTPQTKDSDHELTISFKLKWGRILTN